MSGLVEIYSSCELSEVLCAQSYLESYNIYTLLLNEHHGTINNWFVLALGGFRLAVLSDDAADAKQLLKEADQRGAVSKPESARQTAHSPTQHINLQ